MLWEFEFLHSVVIMSFTLEWKLLAYLKSKTHGIVEPGNNLSLKSDLSLVNIKNANLIAFITCILSRGRVFPNETFLWNVLMFNIYL